MTRESGCAFGRGRLEKHIRAEGQGTRLRLASHSIRGIDEGMTRLERCSCRGTSKIGCSTDSLERVEQAVVEASSKSPLETRVHRGGDRGWRHARGRMHCEEDEKDLKGKPITRSKPTRRTRLDTVTMAG